MAVETSQVGTQRPYLLRAMHEWMIDNNLTPHIVVDANREGLTVPREHVTDGKLIFNLSFSATQNLDIGNELVEFGARFGGVPRRLTIPISAVLGIYARETGQGMVFADEDAAEADSSASNGDQAKPEAAKSPSLKIVK